jgi:SAM domain (Sterile alpha motif)
LTQIISVLRALERYANTFRDNAIGVAVLPELREADLEKLGVLLGHRKILAEAHVALGDTPFPE